MTPDNKDDDVVVTAGDGKLPFPTPQEYAKKHPFSFLGIKLAFKLVMILVLSFVGMLFWNHIGAPALGFGPLDCRQSVIVLVLVRMLKSF